MNSVEISIGKNTDLRRENEKEDVVCNVCSNILGTCLDREHKVNLDELMLSSHGPIALGMPFSEEEMWKTICDLPSDKAPGPDWFIGRLYKSCWPIIKENVMAAIFAVCSRNHGNMGLLNSVYIILLLKKEEALHIKDF